jgi:hypothetical protein
VSSGFIDNGISKINRTLLCKRFWIFISIVVMGIYLYPLLLPDIHVPVYDNLDSTVIWNKILVESGKIFAPNSEIVPNMMNGLPRASYGSEFDVQLWLYYFFSPKVAYIINELLIHIIAFFGMYIFLSKYIVPEDKYYRYILIYVGTLYFALLPFWSGAGASIATLPLTTYVLFNIKNGVESKWEWLYLILLPLYSSLIYVYMFYIIYAGFYWLYIGLKYKSINYRLLGAIFLMGLFFLFKEYRLVYSTFIDSSFVSHRTEFDVFFHEDLASVYELTVRKFLNGKIPHLEGLQRLYLIPMATVALILAFTHRKYNKNESVIIWFLIIVSFLTGIWEIVLGHKYFLIVIFFLSTLLLFFNKRYKNMALVFLSILFISFLTSFLFQYKEFKWVTDYLPILNSLNIVRAYFIVPLLLTTLLIYSISIYIRKLHYTPVFIFIFVIVQSTLSIDERFYETEKSSTFNYLSFDKYYAPKIFKQLKRDIEDSYPDRNITTFKFISYGLEPAVSLFNGLYTVDGYSVNYPLNYKKKFRQVMERTLNSKEIKGNELLYDRWGSKLYILTISSRIMYYRLLVVSQPKIHPVYFNANIDGVCKLGTNFVISSYPLKGIENKPLKLFKKYRDRFWRIWLYEIECFN